MKKTLFTITFILSVIFQITAQTPNPETEKLKLLNQKTVENYKAGKYDEALVSARQSLDLTIQMFGAEHLETAASYSNLGEVYRAKKQHEKGAENLQKALDIYQKQPVKDFKKISTIAESIGVALVFDDEREKAGEFIALAVAAAEKGFGKESRELLPLLKNQADYYQLTKQFDKMDELYIRRYLIAQKVYGRDSSELTKIEEERYCVVIKTFGNPGEFLEKQKAFTEATRENAILNSGVINGQAVSLPKPEYPMRARRDRAGGTFPVRVLIDETGKVIQAESICGGHPALREASQKAASKAKFKPTEFGGKPIKVNGIIVYSFVP